ncbi:sperm flagellar protein 2-like isoform X2 [Hydractinia symbiolongicarpus]|uniref:sperm flagellar protein 2-like isoform X2 n=1 Tax=Hydractinia symbiolongicarpus TaxID=13093 RepID=UPI00254BE25E|nr:sperm flagellar protein 2-like isoform X2 [Hydractinia symbiolongicarpus]
MSEILCKWLNEDVKLSQKVDPNNFAECFGNGYLIGELLSQYGLQDDFSLFSQSRSADTKLNNFFRIEPTMALLDIKFDTNMAREIINERPGMATRLLYQLFIALGKKSKMNLTGFAMETMRPLGPARLGVIESDMYKERLKTLVPRQVDVDFDKLVTKYDEKQREVEEQALRAKQEEERKLKKYQQGLRQKELERSRQIREQQDKIMAKIKGANVKIPKPPQQKKSGKTQQEVLKEREIQSVYCNIDKFEKRLQNMRSIASPESSDQIREIDVDIETFLSDSQTKKSPKTSDFVKPEENFDYVMKIRQRLNEDANARKEREKRRRKVLVEQMEAHEIQQESARENILVNRLMRQSQMERRIAVQLMHVRHEKEVIRNNRLERERQFTERRLQDFQDALEREAAICHQAKIDYAKDVQQSQELHDSIAKERALRKSEKHYGICREILLDIVDFACKVGEYRELTEKHLPPKIVREWKALFLNSKPLYEYPVVEVDPEAEELLALEESKQTLLDEEDFLEYKNFVGEWIPVEGQSSVVKENTVLGFILKRLNNILYPPTPPPPEPEFPAFPIKVCVLGKFFSGKTRAIQQIASTHRIQLLDVEVIVDDALEAWKCQEMIPPVLDIELASRESCSELKLECDGEIVSESKEFQETEQVVLPEKVMETTGQPETNEDENPGKVVTRNSEAASATPDTSLKKGSIAMTESDTSLHLTESKENQLTLRAKLGGKANVYLKKGRGIPDSLLVDILVEHIRNIPDGTGWIIDGFPMNIQQAKLLEKALTGYEAAPSPRKSVVKKGRKSRLAPDPYPPAEVKVPKSGIDVVVLFDVSDEVVLRRAEGRSYDPETGEEFHEEFNPPPEGCYTGLQSKNKVNSVVDTSNDKEQAQIRLTTFQDNWPKLEKWFNRFNVLQTVDADTSYEDVCSQLKDILDSTLQRLVTPVPEDEPIQQKIDEEVIAENLANPAAPEAPPEGGEKDLGTKTELKEETSDPPTPAEVSKKGQKKDPESPSPTKKGKGKGKKEGGQTPTKKKKESASSKRSSSTKSSSQSLRKTESHVEEVVITIEEPVEPPSPEPGDDDWVYVEQPIDEEFVQMLLNNWDIVEETYIASCKHTFRKIRHENEAIYRYFYTTRKNFVEFLQRPDEKQIYVSQWQKEYNDFPHDMRSDENAKAELHQRVDDLCDVLWDICDSRKEDAESERNTIMTEGWLEDHLGLLANHYISLVQMEIDRYQQTCKMVRDYYVAMEDGDDAQKVKLLSDGVPQFSRIPLIDIPATLPPSPNEPELTETSSSQLSVTASTTTKPTLKTPEPSAEEKKGRIPLISRQPSPGDLSPTRMEKKRSSSRKEKGSAENMESPLPPSDQDEKLLYDAVLHAFHVIEAQVASDIADDEAEASLKADKTNNELTKIASKDKKGKKLDKERKSPSKVSKTPVRAPTPAQIASPLDIMSEEELQRQMMREKMRKEYKTIVRVEATGLKSRVESIRTHGGMVIKKLKEKTQATYTDMDNWLGKRFLEEMESISKMADVIRQNIENECQLQDAVILEDKEFFIDDFKEIAPSGLVNIKAFVNVVTDMTASTACLETVPERWLNITPTQLGTITSELAINNEYINWKEFMVYLSVPYPIPSANDLRNAVTGYQSADPTSSGVITDTDYQQIPIWLEEQGEHLEEKYDRAKNLKQIFFEIFSFETCEGDLLNYKDMLLYFVTSDDALDGLLTALSIVSGLTLPDAHLLRGLSSDSQENIMDVDVLAQDWMQVFNHGERGHGGDHRFNLDVSSSGLHLKDEIEGVYEDLGYTSSDAIPLKLLYGHPLMRDLIDGCVKYTKKDINKAFSDRGEDIIEEEEPVVT